MGRNGTGAPRRRLRAACRASRDRRAAHADRFRNSQPAGRRRGARSGGVRRCGDPGGDARDPFTDAITGRERTSGAVTAGFLPAPLAGIPWRVLVPLTLLVGFGAAILYSAAGGSMQPYATSHLIRFAVFLVLAL